MTRREDIVKNYIEGYNEFDINKMIRDFDENVVFENISGGEVNMLLEGLEAFMEQADQVKSYFLERTQTIKSFKHGVDETEVEINYYAILAKDFPNGLKRGDELKLQGRSVFKFSGNQIINLTDIS
ncbi:nuclear transport factor 2 family protein [Segetibacter sp.]|jgi:hypothetical protein|uniref:nuclear transport factor 2 family protein n=1 Tax=Segetibacter sp. TaxID=2231182 RepID=UPI002611F956|nr:nuclear transport factor 2 family protein [Segetibacter sp.]MCW3081539.1 hypothetical protein [Segetibacter sp.]